MKNSRLKHILGIFLALLFVLTALECKKYPENNGIQWTRKNKRILGTWEPVAFLINNIDSLEVLKSKGWYGPYFFDNIQNENPVCYIISDSATYYAIDGHWSFDDHKNFLLIDFSESWFSTTHYGPYGEKGATLDTRWAIMKFTDKELWLETDYDAKKYFVKFNKL